MTIKFKYLFSSILLISIHTSCKTIDSKIRDSDNDGLFDYKDRCPHVKGNITNHGCPKKEENKYTGCCYGASIQYDSLELTPSEKELTKKACLFEAIKKSEYSFLLIGHYFDNETSEKNLKLSYQRADNLKSYIVKKYKIIPSKLIVEAKGNQQPISTSNSENNRVEIKIIR